MSKIKKCFLSLILSLAIVLLSFAPAIVFADNLNDGDIAAPMPLSIIATGQFPNAGADIGAVWTLFDDGTLVVDPGRVHSNGVNSPWITYNNDIEKVIFNDPITGGTSLRGLFAGLTELTVIEGLNYFDTSSVTNMESVFRNTSSLTCIGDVSEWNTSNVTTMTSMFRYSYSLTCVGDISNWDTSQVSLMQFMFSASGVEELDLSGWETGNVINMNAMFMDMSSLENIHGLSGWDTGEVTNLSFMFSGVENIENLLDISVWDVSNVTTMDAMFRDATSLVYLDLSAWETNSVINTSRMFQRASGLLNLDLSEWDVSTVDNMASMFAGTSNLTSAGDLSMWQTGNVSTMGAMFYGASSLINFGDISGWDVSNVNNMNRMFREVSSITQLDLSGWDVGNVSTMYAMFMDMSSLENIHGLSGWDTKNLTNTAFMFSGANNLKNLYDLFDWDVSNVTITDAMFRDASSLITLDLSNWDVGNVTDMGRMFQRASSLEILDFSGWDTSGVTTMFSMLAGTTSLRQITFCEYFINSTGTNPALPAITANATYTGMWQNVGNGTLNAPLGTFILTSAELMTLMTVGGEDLADTWVWQRTPFWRIGSLNNHIFPPDWYGYDPQTPHNVTLTNTGNQPTGDLAITLSGANPGSFIISQTTISSIDITGTASFTVAPVTGLPPGVHTAAITVVGNNNISESFEVFFTVNPIFEFTKTDSTIYTDPYPIQQLPGAVFHLYREIEVYPDGAFEWQFVSTYTSGESGIAGQSGLVQFELDLFGRYKLVEQTPPLGHHPADGHWLIEPQTDNADAFDYFRITSVPTISGDKYFPDFVQPHDNRWFLGNFPLPEFIFHKTNESLYNQQNWTQIFNFLEKGARFELFRYNGTTEPPRDIIYDNMIGDGQNQWTLVGYSESSGLQNLPMVFHMTPGRYYQLIETVAPDGFELPPGQWRIVVDDTAPGGFAISYVGDSTTPEFIYLYEHEAFFVGNRRHDIPPMGISGHPAGITLMGLFLILLILKLIVRLVAATRPKNPHPIVS